MPIKDEAKRKAYDRQRKAKKRAIEKARIQQEQWDRGNINYSASKPKTEQYMSYEEFKRQNPKSSFREYLSQKIKFERDNRVEPIRRISREQAFKIRGFDLWHGTDEKQEEIEEHHRQADILEEFLNSPAHPPRPKERYNWKQDLEDEIAKLNKDMKPKKKDEE